MAWLAGAAPREKRGQMIGSAMGAAIAGALLGPVIGVAADLIGFELVFCTVAADRRRPDGWTWRTPAAAPLGDGSLRGLAGALRNGQVRTGLALITVPGLLFGTLSRARAAAARRARRDDGRDRRDLADERGARGDRLARWRAASATAAGSWRRCSAGWSAARSRSPCCRGPMTRVTLGILIVLGSPVIGLLWAPSMAMLSDGADAVGLEQGLAFGLMNLTWATGQASATSAAPGSARPRATRSPTCALSAICILAFVVLRARLAPAARDGC